MRFGMHLRELSRLRVGLAVSVLVALLAGLWSVASIGLFPPSLKSRSLEMATAYTEVMVDTPRSALLDTRQTTDDIHSLVNRAVLVGSLMATPSVRAYIAQRVGVPADILQIEAPRTPFEPAPRKVTGRSNGPMDLFRTTNQYRLDIQADPVVPFLDIYAQGPTASAAGQLANAAVDGVGEYLRNLAASQGTPQRLQVQLRQFGRAQGKVLKKGIQWQIAFLASLAAFAVAATAAVAIGRIKRGWSLEPASPVQRQAF
jgi:hypothetical protein